MFKYQKSKSYKDYLYEKLKNPEQAQEYLNAAFEDYFQSNDLGPLLLAIRDIAETKGMAVLAKQTHLNRQSLYKSLSEEGNPSFGTICAILKMMGLQIGIKESIK
jgi:probable addiction module antidote protein